VRRRGGALVISKAPDDKEPDIPGWVLSEKRGDLTANNTADARRLADSGRIVNRNGGHGVGPLETSVCPETVGREIPEEYDTDCEGFGKIVANDIADLGAKHRHPEIVQTVVYCHYDQEVNG